MKLNDFILITTLALSLASSAFAGPEIGVYKGSFDPPTLAHRSIGIQAIEELHLDLLYIVLNQTSRWKNYGATPEQRVQMLQILFRDRTTQVRVVEKVSGGMDALVAKIREKHGIPSVHQIIGQDSFEKIETRLIKDPTRHWVVVPRAGHAEKHIPNHPNVSVLIERTAGISSTKVREAVREGIDPSAWIDVKVLELIRENQLYTTALQKPLPTSPICDMALYRDRDNPFENDYYSEL